MSLGVGSRCGLARRTLRSGLKPIAPLMQFSIDQTQPLVCGNAEIWLTLRTRQYRLDSLVIYGILLLIPSGRSQYRCSTTRRMQIRT